MKKNVLFWLFALLFPVIFNIIFWSAGTANKPSVWVSYAFIHIAWLAAAIAIRRGTADRTHDRSVTSFPAYIFSAVYLAAELLTGLIFILTAPDGFLAALVIQLILLGIYLICMVKAVGAENRTQKNTESLDMDREYVRKASQKLKALCLSVKDTPLHDKLDSVYQIISASPVRSTSAAREDEMKVLDLAEELSSKINTLEKETCLDMIEQIRQSALRRNTLL